MLTNYKQKTPMLQWLLYIKPHSNFFSFKVLILKRWVQYVALSLSAISEMNPGGNLYKKYIKL